MLNLKQRKAVIIGGSTYVSLPKEWTLHNNIEKGNLINACINDEGHLIFTPFEMSKND